MRAKAIAASLAAIATVAVVLPAGSASFALTSPTSDTFEGDLAVELPGLGEVPLTGTGIAAGTCHERGGRLTKGPRSDASECLS